MFIPKNDVFDEDLQKDDRMHWPATFYHHLCECEANYFGLACDECWFGWKGPNCDEHEILVRRNILTYSPEERRRFVEIVKQMPKVPGDRLILFEKDAKHADPLNDPVYLPANLQLLMTSIHSYSSRSTLFEDKEKCQVKGYLDNNHNVIGFLTWHRYFMLHWERELRKVASQLYGWHDFTIPYWDWLDAKDCEVCVNSLVGAPGPWFGAIHLLDPVSPFSNFTEYCTIPTSGGRCYACHTTWPSWAPLNRHYVALDFPTTADLEFTLSRRSFFIRDPVEGMTKCRSFHQALEGFCGRSGANGTYMYMHNKVHNMVYGSHCCSATSTNDPLFLLHHTQVDRIFDLWLTRNDPRLTEYPEYGVAPGSCRACALIGWLPVVRHGQLFTQAKHLGIKYDSLQFGKRGFAGENYLTYGPRHAEGYYTNEFGFH